MRGRLLETASESDLVAIGDRVRIDIPVSTESMGAIDFVAPRKSVLSRALRTSGLRGEGMPEREQVLVANADVALIVFAILQPKTNMRMLDRFLIAAERADIPQIVIVINKIDLLADSVRQPLSEFQSYKKLGYPLIGTSAKPWLRLI